MSDAARIVDVRDAVADYLRETWAPVAPAAVETAWVWRGGFDPNDSQTLLPGRRAVVMAVQPALERYTRGGVLNRYTIAVLVADRYTGDGSAGDLDQWVNELVLWWEQTVLYPLWTPSLQIVGPAGVVPCAVPDPETAPEVTAFLDRDLLTDANAAILCANFSFIDVSDHTGAR